MLALIAYVFLRTVDKQLDLKRSRDASRHRAEGLGQARHPGFAGPEFAGTEYPGAQHTGPRAAIQS